MYLFLFVATCVARYVDKGNLQYTYKYCIVIDYDIMYPSKICNLIVDCTFRNKILNLPM